MTTKITIVTQEKSIPFSSVKKGEKFMYAFGKMQDNVYMRINDLYEVSKDRYLKNVVNISTGTSVEIPPQESVVLVDLEIKAIK